jgi:hypothetical protein
LNEKLKKFKIIINIFAIKDEKIKNKKNINISLSKKILPKIKILSVNFENV